MIDDTEGDGVRVGVVLGRTSKLNLEIMKWIGVSEHVCFSSEFSHVSVDSCGFDSQVSVDA